MLVRFLRDHALPILRGSRSNADPPNVQRKSGHWHPQDTEWLARIARDVPGDFAEIGVFRGENFKVLVTQAAKQHKLAHAFDSFVGMDDPSPEDGPDYPKGRFSIGGVERFAELMSAQGLSPDTYRLWAGYIPECFDHVVPETRYSFVIVDVDHYKPTVISLAWACPRINSGGILALDDYLPETDRYATKAITEFLQRDGDFEQIAQFNQQLILRKK